MSEIVDEYTRAQDRGLTISEAGIILGYSRDTIVRMLKDGTLLAYGEGRKVRIYEFSIHDYRQRTDYCAKTNKKGNNGLTKVSKRHNAAMERIHALLE